MRLHRRLMTVLAVAVALLGACSTNDDDIAAPPESAPVENDTPSQGTDPAGPTTTAAPAPPPTELVDRLVSANGLGDLQRACIDAALTRNPALHRDGVDDAGIAEELSDCNQRIEFARDTAAVALPGQTLTDEQQTCLTEAFARMSDQQILDYQDAARNPTGSGQAIVDELLVTYSSCGIPTQ